MMWDPVRYLESCPSSDGACAVVFTDEAGGDDAAAAGRPPAWVLGTAVRSEPSQFPGRDPVRPVAASDCADRRVRARPASPTPASRSTAPSCTCRSRWYEPMWLEAHHIAEPGRGLEDGRVRRRPRSTARSR